MNGVARTILYLCVTASVCLQALTPVNMGNILELTKEIEKGTVTGPDIIRRIKALNLRAADEAADIVRNLNIEAVTALQQDKKYANTVKATTNLIQDVRTHKITVLQPKPYIDKEYTVEIVTAALKKIDPEGKEPAVLHRELQIGSENLMKQVALILRSVPYTESYDIAIKCYYLLQLAKLYRHRITDDNTVADMQKINAGLEALLTKTVSGDYVWSIIQDFESRSLNSIETSIQASLQETAQKSSR